MGLCGSSPIYHYTDVQLKELQSATPLFTLLGIKWNSKQAQTLHNVFDSCVDNSESEANVKAAEGQVSVCGRGGRGWDDST